ncbi:MAG: hypothetical protein ACK5RG_13290 [Cyclobacteriaceae bacterium]|jgi:hypothetical protein|nr:hypothetical protein [Flammeovirgaceae bacterium]
MKSESPGNGIPFAQGMYFYGISKSHRTNKLVLIVSFNYGMNLVNRFYTNRKV